MVQTSIALSPINMALLYVFLVLLAIILLGILAMLLVVHCNGRGQSKSIGLCLVAPSLDQVPPKVLPSTGGESSPRYQVRGKSFRRRGSADQVMRSLGDCM